MLRRKALPALLALALAGCSSGGSRDLLAFEVDYLSEDVLDLMTIVFQAGENGFVGDGALPGDVLEPATPANRFSVLYELPDAFRVGLGAGAGTVILSVAEDGLPHPDPLAFSFATTAATRVQVVYDLRYLGETPFGRPTDVAFIATLDAQRVGAGWEVEYFVEGDCYLGEAYCDILTRFRAPGRPRDGIDPTFGDGEGIVDDPDVVDILDLDLDFGSAAFRAQGDVGPFGYFDEDFFYEEVF